MLYSQTVFSDSYEYKIEFIDSLKLFKLNICYFNLSSIFFFAKLHALIRQIYAFVNIIFSCLWMFLDTCSLIINISCSMYNFSYFLLICGAWESFNLCNIFLGLCSYIISLLLAKIILPTKHMHQSVYVLHYCK